MKSHFTSLISLFPVKDIEVSLAWYKQWLGEPDNIPMDGIAEYQLTDSACLQLSKEEGTPNNIIISVDDVHQVKAELDELGIATGQIMDWELVLVLTIEDPDGNRISFAQELEIEA